MEEEGFHDGLRTQVPLLADMRGSSQVLHDPKSLCGPRHHSRRTNPRSDCKSTEEVEVVT
jgi:hypothetical protein